ncbi:hypothetical protein ABIB83_007357 [Bradyrhizobium sp. I1.8.5]
MQRGSREALVSSHHRRIGLPLTPDWDALCLEFAAVQIGALLGRPSAHSSHLYLGTRFSMKARTASVCWAVLAARTIFSAS